PSAETGDGVMRNAAISDAIGRQVGQDAEGEKFELAGVAPERMGELVDHLMQNGAPGFDRVLGRPQIYGRSAILEALEQSSEQMRFPIALGPRDDELRFRRARRRDPRRRNRV